MEDRRKLFASNTGVVKRARGMTKDYASEYSWAEEPVRLAALEDGLDPGTRSHVTRLGIDPGCRRLEIATI
jgi:hypothetical protein